MGLGDIDADGFDDFVVGYWVDAYYPGVRLVHGPGAISRMEEATLLAHSNDDRSGFGISMARAGDHDHDGMSDVLIGAAGAGQAHLVSTAASELIAGESDIASFEGPSGGHRFGHETLANADFNGDGEMDAAISATNYGDDDETWYAGAVYVFSGPLVGIRAAADASTTIGAGLDAEILPRSLLGSGLAASDFNGDGYSDLAVGAPGTNPDGERPYEGAVYLFHGPLDAIPSISSADFRFLGEVDGHQVGGELQADVNLDEDQQGDLLVGNTYIYWNGDGGQSQGFNPGRAWLLYGPFSGTRLASQADVTFINENSDGYSFGMQVQAVGDSNGDGKAEVLLGDFGPLIQLFEIPEGY